MLDAVAGQDNVAVALLMRSETGLIALDAEQRVVLANPAAGALLGMSGAVNGLTLSAVLAKQARLGAQAERWLAGGANEAVFLSLDAESKLSIVPAPGPDGHRLLSITRVQRVAPPATQRDALTGLADRSWFMERLAATLEAPGAGSALLMIDLDRFKAVNDSFGHPVGDALLQLVAKRLTGAMRDADVICRLSGDEFAVVMKRPQDPDGVGRRLVSLLSRPYLIEGTTVSVGASIGIAMAPEHGGDSTTLIRAADVALYAAKNGGRCEARVFDAEMDARSRQRQRLAEALRQAVPLEQLDLHFQPQMVIETGELTGFEAFIRWHHPEMGWLMPPAFLPVAEDSGLIWPIGEWVLRRACEEALRWPPHLSVSVNVSARQMIDRHRLPRMIKSALLKTGLAPSRLEIEVPESTLTQQPEALAILKAIDALGVRVSLDDFGTGYTSLHHLRRFPLHKLKIDHSLVQALGQSDEATNVVRAIAALGRTLGIVTIAEGVETLDQRHRVEEDGCEEIQGYVLSRPVPSSEIGSIIARLPSATGRAVPAA